MNSPKTQPVKTYPYQELGLENLKGETWEDIPWLDGLYLISNFGRVKRLEFEVLCRNGKTMHYYPKIRKACLEINKNVCVNDYNYFLSVSIVHSGKRYKFSVARLVYYCFNKKFSLDDYSLVVLAKDGDGRNTRPSNLELASIYRKQQRIIERGRYMKEYETTYDEFIKEGKTASKNTRSKQVSQYTSTGKFIQTFPSLQVAEIITGVLVGGIIGVLKKRHIFSGGFTWAYGEKQKIDVQGIRKANLERRKLLVGQKVTQYNLKGKKIAFYLTIKDASKKTKVNVSDIHAVLNGKQRSAGGFIWRKEFGEDSIDVESFLTGEAWRAFRRQKVVKQYSKSGKLINTFPSGKAAAEHIGVNSSYISIAIKSKEELRGYKWKFA